MTETTARFALPFILPGQAQKEAYHNEALARLDVMVHAAVEGEGPAQPPSDPAAGQCWIVPSGAEGAWTGRDGAIAGWTSGGWRFVAPTDGITVWDKAAGVSKRWTGGDWNGGELICARVIVEDHQVVGPRHAAIASPAGGTTIDVEARDAIEAIIATLMSHGLIE